MLLYCRGDIMQCIYAIENKLNHKKYIGMTNNYKNRIYNHFYELKNNKHHSKKLQRAYNKYGRNNFTNYVLFETDKMEGLEIKEKELIKLYNTYKNGYNCSEGGEKLPNYKMPETARQALIKRNKGNKYMLGKHLSEETKKKMSEVKKGKKGKPHTEKAKRKISKKIKNNWESNYNRYYEKIYKANTSEKRRKEVSIQMTGENNNNAKVTAEDVKEIRRRYANGEKPRNIIKAYPQITKSGLRKIYLRITWKNV